MRFVTLLRLPDHAVTWGEGTPTQLIREAIEREEAKIESLYGVNGGFDAICVFECQSPEAQMRVTMTLKRAGFYTETRSCIPATELDTAWENAVKHPVAVGRH